jgi:RHS repeat-associated protein
MCRKYWYTKNVQGDVVAICDEQGVLVASYEYDAWGKCTIISSVNGIAELNAIRYRGYYFDVETGFYYCRTRYYDAEVCRWISPDIVEILHLTKHQVNGLNLYMYCGNDPVNQIDPSGLFWKKVGQALLGPVSWLFGGVSGLNPNNPTGPVINPDNLPSPPVIPKIDAPILDFASGMFGWVSNYVVQPIVGGVNVIGNWFGMGNIGTSLWDFMTNPIQGMHDGFWNLIGLLNDNFSNTLEVLSWLPAIGVPMLFTPLAPVGLALCIIGGIAFFVSILNNYRPKNRPRITN